MVPYIRLAQALGLSLMCLVVLFAASTLLSLMAVRS